VKKVENYLGVAFHWGGLALQAVGGWLGAWLHCGGLAMQAVGAWLPGMGLRGKQWKAD